MEMKLTPDLGNLGKLFSVCRTFPPCTFCLQVLWDKERFLVFHLVPGTLCHPSFNMSP